MDDGRVLALGVVAVLAAAGAVASSRRGSSGKGKDWFFVVGGVCDFGPGREEEPCEIRVVVPESVQDLDDATDAAYKAFYNWIDEQGGREPWELYCRSIHRVSFREPGKRGSRATDRDDWLWSAKTSMKFESFPGETTADFEREFSTLYSDPAHVNETAAEILDEYGQQRFDRWRDGYSSRQSAEAAGYQVRLIEGPTRRSFRNPGREGR